MSEQLSPAGLKALIGSGNFKVIGQEVPRPDSLVNVGPVPLASIQAVFDFLSHLETGEVERKLATWTDLTPEQIKVVSNWIDVFYDLLYNAGMRPAKVKKELLRTIIRPNIGRYIRVKK